MQIRTQKVKLSSTDIKRIYFEAFPKGANLFICETDIGKLDT